MPVKVYKPTSAGRRNMSVSSFDEITRGKPERALLGGRANKSGGRNVHGRITTFQRGGGHKRRHRKIDFRREKAGVPARVASIEYDPNRSANIALLHYLDGEKRYILAPNGLKVGDELESGPNSELRSGNAMPIANIPLGTQIHAVELKPGKGAQIARSAGTSAQLIAREGRYSTLRLRSGEMRKVLSVCRATVGEVSNSEHGLVKLGKAGASRHRGIRPTVRGVVMNPVDHPHGGGEGKTSGGRHHVSPWGTPTKGYKTRKNKRTDHLIVRRRNKR